MISISISIAESIIFTYLINCRNYCSALIDQYDVFDEIIECLEQKQFKQYSVKAGKVKSAMSVPGTAGNLQFLLR
jgi:hypothetical protein